jgi:hydrogenase expression/formation protein HypD
MQKISSRLSKLSKKVSEDHRIRIMNFCGTHEYTISHSGIRSILPPNIELIPGPGCPVCVCAQEDIKEAIELSLRDNIVLLTYGDMLRVPAGGSSLEQTKGKGADIRFVGSPLEAIKIAMQNPSREIVLFSVGFETTTAPLAALISGGNLPKNLSFLISHKLTPPVMELLLGIGDICIDGFIAPGHVSTIIGAKMWQIFPEAFRMPTVVAGFEPHHVISAIELILEQVLSREARLGNVYEDVAGYDGNKLAQEVIEKVFELSSSWWRGIGRIPRSGYRLREGFWGLDARKRFGIESKPLQEKIDPRCLCHLVVMGKIYPRECPLFGKSCRPDNPFGPCMVSHEGTCRIWWEYQNESYGGGIG